MEIPNKFVKKFTGYALVPNKDLKAIALRYFNPIGSLRSALIGELHLGDSGKLSPFYNPNCYWFAGKNESVYGNDYNTPDGSCIQRLY